MIRTKTVFILGAGASVNFCYPSGEGLRDKILEQKHKNAIIAAVTDSHIPGHKQTVEEEYGKFINAFSKATTASIDHFLEAGGKEYMNIGKASIAPYFIEQEDDNNLRKTKDNWYYYLFNHRMLESAPTLAEFQNNNISFITFNYDRSLEQYFFEALKYHYNEHDDKRIKDCMDALKIVHLYGQLGLLPWQTIGTSEEVFLYKNTGDYSKRIKNAIKDIQLINEERDIEKNERFLKAYTLIQETERICFLGFGFDKDNLRRLKLEKMKNKKIDLTMFEVEQTKENMIRSYFQGCDVRYGEPRKKRILEYLKENFGYE